MTSAVGLRTASRPARAVRPTRVGRGLRRRDVGVGGRRARRTTPRRTPRSPPRARRRPPAAAARPRGPLPRRYAPDAAAAPRGPRSSAPRRAATPAAPRRAPPGRELRGPAGGGRAPARRRERVELGGVVRRRGAARGRPAPGRPRRSRPRRRARADSSAWPAPAAAEQRSSWRRSSARSGRVHSGRRGGTPAWRARLGRAPAAAPPAGTGLVPPRASACRTMVGGAAGRRAGWPRAQHDVQPLLAHPQVDVEQRVDARRAIGRRTSPTPSPPAAMHPDEQRRDARRTGRCGEQVVVANDAAERLERHATRNSRARVSAAPSARTPRPRQNVPSPAGTNGSSAPHGSSSARP